jgi:hypothetical protein
MSHLYLCPSRGADTLRVSLIGRLDQHTAAAFTTSLCAMLPTGDQPATDLVLNLRCCTAMDVDSVTALENVRHVVMNTGGSLRLEDVPPLLEHLLTERGAIYK